MRACDDVPPDLAKADAVIVPLIIVLPPITTPLPSGSTDTLLLV